MAITRTASAAATAAHGDPAGDPELLGRARERELLAAIAGAVCDGSGQIVIIGGEAGIGKSRLAAEVIRDCERRGFSVLRGCGDEVEQRRPFGVVTDALGLRDRAPVTLEAEAQIADRLVAAVQERCRPGPLVLLLDDLQWADESSLVAINGIAREVAAQPLLLLCALRPYPSSGPLRALLATLGYRGAHRLELDGLGGDAVTELATRLTGSLPGPRLRRALREAAGNPFYVTALLACLHDPDGTEAGTDAPAKPAGERLPRSLQATILETLRYLPDETLQVLRAASVVGRGFSVTDVALITPSAVADVAAALDPALRAGLVTAAGERLAFRHDLIREAIYGELAPATRTSLHRDLATRLERAGATPERVADQLMLGAGSGDTEAIAGLRRAAAQARISSPAITAALLERALELTGADAALRGELLGEAVCPLIWTGAAARAEAVCLEGLGIGAAQVLDPGSAPATVAVPQPASARKPAAPDPQLFWLGLADARLLQGRFAQARATCADARAQIELDDADSLHLAALEALCGVYLGDPDGVELARRIVATAPTSAAKGSAQESIGQWELFSGRADRALEAFEQVDAMRSPAALPSRIWLDRGWRVRIWHALALLDLDRIDEAVALLERDLAVKLPVPALPHAFLAACRYHGGRLDAAARECAAASAAARATGSFLPASVPALAAAIALRCGRPAEARQLLAEFEQERTLTDAGGEAIIGWARALLLEASGDATAAAAVAGAALAGYLGAGFASHLAWHAPDLVRMALAAGEREQAEQAVAAAERAAAQLPVASRRTGALRARGLLGDEPVLLLEAVAAAREAPRPLDLALTLRDAAAALARAGQRASARPLALESVQLLTRLGAGGEERHARGLLREAGLALSARSRHTRARHGWESLTASELRVVALVAQGRSNPEIAEALYLSRRTVGWHLSNVFRKLEVSSRVELATAVMRHGLDEPQIPVS